MPLKAVHWHVPPLEELHELLGTCSMAALCIFPVEAITMASTHRNMKDTAPDLAIKAPPTRIKTHSKRTFWVSTLSYSLE